MVNEKERKDKQKSYTKYHVGKLRYEAGDYQSAVEFFTIALNTSESLKSIEDVYFWRGKAYNDLHQYDKAVQDLTKVIENAPTVNPLALNERGFAHEKLKQYENAISDYTTAIEHKSADWGIYENRAFVYKTTGQWNKALEDYNKAISLGAKEPETFMYRGVVHAKLAGYTRAIEDLSRAIELDRNYPNPYFFRAQAFTDSNRFEKAVEDYNTVIQFKPNHDVAYNNLSFLYNISQCWDRSISSSNKAIELCTLVKKTSGRSFAHRGFAKANVGKIEEALQDCDQCIRFENDTYPRGYCYRAFVYLCMDRLEESLKDCDKALELSNNDLYDVYYIRAMIYQRQKLIDRAALELNKCNQDPLKMKLFANQWSKALRECKEKLFCTTVRSLRIIFEEKKQEIIVDSTQEFDVVMEEIINEMDTQNKTRSTTGFYKLKKLTENSLVEVNNVKEIDTNDFELMLVYTPHSTQKKRPCEEIASEQAKRANLSSH